LVSWNELGGYGVLSPSDGLAFLFFVRYMGLYDIPRCNMGVLSSLICLGWQEGNKTFRWIRRDGNMTRGVISWWLYVEHFRVFIVWGLEMTIPTREREYCTIQI
jgi:hypothetical protein